MRRGNYEGSDEMQRYFRQRARLVRGYSSRAFARPPVVHTVGGGSDNYALTLGNLKINEKTRVMYQGFTGSYSVLQLHRYILILDLV